MNISTTSSNTSISSSQSNVGSVKVSDASFEQEMKAQVDVQTTQETDKTEDNTKANEENELKGENVNEEANKFAQEAKKADEIVPSQALEGNLNYTDYKYHNESQSLLSKNIQNLLNTRNIMTTVSLATTVDFDVVNMSDSDANFFINLVQNTDMSMKNIATEISQSNSSQTVHSVQVSSVLMEKLAESMKTNQPFRIDFDKDVSVIIKVNKDGSLAANFIPGDKAVEQYLRNNISSLRQRFDEENISYSELSYSNSKEQQKRRKKENDNE